MLIFQKVPHKNVIDFVISLLFSIFAAKKIYMERFIMQDLIAWKNREDRKPLILLGERQVGKTYILKEFGNAMHHFNGNRHLSSQPFIAQ